MGGYEGKSGWAEYHPVHGPDIYFELEDGQGNDNYDDTEAVEGAVHQVPVTTAEALRRQASEGNDQPST